VEVHQSSPLDAYCAQYGDRCGKCQKSVKGTGSVLFAQYNSFPESGAAEGSNGLGNFDDTNQSGGRGKNGSERKLLPGNFLPATQTEKAETGEIPKGREGEKKSVNEKEMVEGGQYILLQHSVSTQLLFGN